MPTGEMIPDQDADGQFLYSYGYGYPRYAYATAPWAPTYHIPVGKFETTFGSLMVNNFFKLCLV